MWEGYCYKDNAGDRARGRQRTPTQASRSSHFVHEHGNEGHSYVDEPLDSVRDPQGARMQTSSDPFHNFGNDDASDLDEYDLISHHEFPGPSNAHPSREEAAPYHFPGTWTKAKADSCDALKQVGSASKVFASAIVKSGIGKASWSVGSALASTANRGVAMAAGAALNASGTDQKKLPGPLRRWLGTDKIEAAKRRKQQADHAGVLEKAKQELIENGQVVDSMSISRATSVVSRRGRGRQEDLYEAVVVPEGGVYGHPDSEADEIEYSSLSAGQSPNPAHADTIFGSAHTSAVPRQHVSAIVESPYADTGGRAYFDGPATSAGWASRRQSLASMGESSRPVLGQSPLTMGSRVDVENELGLRDEEEEGDCDFEGMRGLFGEE